MTALPAALAGRGSRRHLPDGRVHHAEMLLGLLRRLACETTRVERHALQAQPTGRSCSMRHPLLGSPEP